MNLTWAPGEGRPRAGPQAWGAPLVRGVHATWHF